MSTVAAAFAAIPVILYKRIPWIKTFTSTKARVLWSIFFIMFPLAVVSAIQATRFSDMITRHYKLNGEKFVEYKRSGDITKINPEITLVDY